MLSTHTRATISELGISPVALGCWPLAGITSGAITEEAAVAVIHAALDAGVNHLDTAYAYGRDGESEQLIARAIRGRREQVVLATKVGVYWDERGALKLTGKPELLRRHFEESLRRLETDAVELLYFHAPAEDAPLAESARFFREVLDAGKTRAVGVSNLSVAQMKTFAAECPFVACQVRYRAAGDGPVDGQVHAQSRLPAGRLAPPLTALHRRGVDEEPGRSRAAADGRGAIRLFGGAVGCCVGDLAPRRGGGFVRRQAARANPRNRRRHAHRGVVARLRRLRCR
ncbi:MAG: aldo/keto reductase [Verrucomicrobia bacterium]|nr:aldo/keto reductase [Verrucomicrobiota bacterium]